MCAVFAKSPQQYNGYSKLKYSNFSNRGPERNEVIWIYAKSVYRREQQTLKKDNMKIKHE